jgi:hypothetical protein
VDDLTGAGEHAVEQRFQLAPMPVEIEEGDWVRARGARGHALLLRAFAAGAPLGLHVEEGGTEPLEGWVSPDYGQREPAPIIIYRAAARLPFRILTLLLPVRDAAATVPALHPLLDNDGVPFGLEFDDHPEAIRFGADSFTIERL